MSGVYNVPIALEIFGSNKVNVRAPLTHFPGRGGGVGEGVRGKWGRRAFTLFEPYFSKFYTGRVGVRM